MQNPNDLIKQAKQAELQGNKQLALQTYYQVLQAYPNELNLLAVCGNLSVELQRFEEAAGFFRRIFQLDNKNLDAQNALCYALTQSGNHAHAEGNFALAECCFEETTLIQPRNAVYWYNLGNAQRELGKPQKALTSYQQSIKLDPNDADAHNNLGNAQRELGLLNQAISSYETALRCNPNLHHALAHLVHQKQHICDWTGLDAQILQLKKLVKSDPHAQISPFAFLAMPGTTAQEQKQCAINWATNLYKMPSESTANTGLQRASNHIKKLKIGYLAADFRLHPLAFLITELIEQHDRNQFEIFAYSYGKNDLTPTRKRLEAAFDRFIEIGHLSDVQAAQKIRQDGIDILVDLTGFTQSSRTGIVALKPASVHINWLGFPGTMGEVNRKPLFDYLIADSTIAPNADDFCEKLLYLPCYQPNDSQRPIGQAGTRTEHGLQANSFVFCCFNQSFKITAEIFAVWMRILKQVPSSILWLLECNAWAKANLHEAAEEAGIDKNRLVFAPRVSIDQHLARHVHADLFLDTLPYNAHTTASDALFMGLPVLTCIGDTFSGRVAASLLGDVGLSELITNDMNTYEKLAIDLSKNNKINIIRDKLKLSIKDSFAFSSPRFRETLEKVYIEVMAMT